MSCTMEQWTKKSVKELQEYLKKRGVPYAKELKAGLVELCTAAAALDIEVDPDGLIEDRAEVLNKKLIISENVKVTCPTILENYTDNIASLPLITIFDIYNYLMNFTDCYDHATFRDYNKMEGFTMAKDGYVLEMTFSSYDKPHENLFTIKSKVKPRTQEKDPITKLKYYNTWLIITSEGRIHSGYCTCKGG